MKFNEGDEVLKNFGNTIYNELGENDITNEYVETYNDSPGLLDGTPEEETQETRKRIFDSLFN